MGDAYIYFHWKGTNSPRFVSKISIYHNKRLIFQKLIYGNKYSYSNYGIKGRYNWKIEYVKKDNTGQATLLDKSYFFVQNYSTLYLKNGKKIKGFLSEQKNNRILLKIKNKLLEFYKKDIDRIENF